MSKRSALINVSEIRKVFELGAKLEDPINLSIGQPDFSIGVDEKAEAHRAIDEGYTRYTLTQGIEPLRDKIARHYQDTYGVSTDKVMITSGVSGAIVTAFFALFEEGDEILLPDPVFMFYEQWARFLGVTVAKYDTYPDFQGHPERIEQHITSKTKVMLVLSPSNPTGAVFSDDDLKRIAEIAERHNILIITDEIYERFTYDDEPTTIAKYTDNVLIMGGFSKFAGMPGMRLGYALGKEDLIMEMQKIQQFSFVCAPSVSQRIGIVCLDSDFTPTLDRYRVKRDIIFNGLKDNFKMVKPGGAFYAFPEVPWGDSQSFCEEAIRNNVLIIPGSAFSNKNTCFRISYANTDEKLKQGIEVLNRLAENPPKGYYRNA